MGSRSIIALATLAASLSAACSSAVRAPAVPGKVVWGEPMTGISKGQSGAGQGPVATKPPVAKAPVTKDPVAKGPAKIEFSPELVRVASMLADAAKHQRRAWDRMAYMCDEFGPRNLGSPGLLSALDWATKTLSLDGLSNPRQEEVMLLPFVRGKESAKIVAPVQRDLHIVGLGLSVPTPKKGIRAALEVVADFEALVSKGERGELKDKIVLVNAAMPPFDAAGNEPHYGQTVRYRTQSASLAAKHGAKAVLVRSVTAHSLQTPHTGGMWYEKDVPKIPAAAITVEDAELLKRLRTRGVVELNLDLRSKLGKKKVKSANVLAELKGSREPEKIVLIGAHIDSWDNGPGAQDDASGVAMVLDAMRLLKSSGLQPKRTIRAVLFTDEESGLRGALDYMKHHGDEPHVAAIEADMGAGAPFALGLGGPEKVRERLGPYLPLFAPLGVQRFSPTGGGADISFLMKQGVLGISIEPRMENYFAIHHTAADTPEKVDPQHLQAHAAAMALMAYLLAQEDLDLTTSAPAAATSAPTPAAKSPNPSSPSE